MKRLFHAVVLALALLVAACSFASAYERRQAAVDQASELRSAYERGYWAGWKQHAAAVGGGL